MKRTVTWNADEELIRRMKIKAATEGKRINELFNEALEQYLEREEKKK